MTNKIYSLMVGRYQPLHAGHIKLIRTVLSEGKNVCVALRDTGVNKQNPYTYFERCEMFKKEFKAEMLLGKIKIIEIPDIEEVVWGRGVGWGRREIKLSKEIENISATKIRNENKKNKK